MSDHRYTLLPLVQFRRTSMLGISIHHPKNKMGSRCRDLAWESRLNLSSTCLFWETLGRFSYIWCVWQVSVTTEKSIWGVKSLRFSFNASKDRTRRLHMYHHHGLIACGSTSIKAKACDALLTHVIWRFADLDGPCQCRLCLLLPEHNVLGLTDCVPTV